MHSPSLCVGNEYYSAQLYVNNAVRGSAYLNVSEGGNETVSGTSVVLLNTGDNVFIQTFSYHPERIVSNSDILLLEVG